MEKNRGIRNVAIMALLIAVVGLSVGFAALSQSLAINGTATVKGNIWSIIFSNPINTTSELATNTGRITTGPTLGSTSTSLDFGVELVKPGDEVSFTVEVKNTGEIPAKISSYSLTGVTEAAAKNVIYKITYLDGTEVLEGDKLAASETKKLKVKVTYDQTSTEILTEDVSLNLTASIIYSQE